jgi:hypothetical protein
MRLQPKPLFFAVLAAVCIFKAGPSWATGNSPCDSVPQRLRAVCQQILDAQDIEDPQQLDQILQMIFATWTQDLNSLSAAELGALLVQIQQAISGVNIQLANVNQQINSLIDQYNQCVANHGENCLAIQEQVMALQHQRAILELVLAFLRMVQDQANTRAQRMQAIGVLKWGARVAGGYLGGPIGEIVR